jgi:hypothetical protein
MNDTVFYTDEEAKYLVIESGSKLTESDNQNFVTTITKDNISSWLVIPSEKPKVDVEEVSKAIDINVTELKPNIPQRRNEFISREQYNSLLSQSIDLNNSIEILRNNLSAANTQISELQAETDNQINQRLSFEQTNTILVNQLTTLSQTIDGFAQQISTALQKSVEESIFRTSLQAQNKGYEAQIQALVTQADSLNAIITGLYLQLGASLVQQNIENEAASLAAASQGFNINEVVFTKARIGTESVSGKLYDYYFIIRNRDPQTWAKWIVGGDLTISNINKVPVEVTIQVYYPRAGFDVDGTTKVFDVEAGLNMTFFKFTETTFTLSAEQKGKSVKAMYRSDDSQLQKFLKSNQGDANSSSVYFPGGYIKITVDNKSTGVKESKVISLALGVLHPDAYEKYT